LLLTGVAAAFIGCNGVEEDEPVWQGPKIGDIAPSPGSRQDISHVIKGVSFNVYVLEIPASKIRDLDSLREMLYTNSFRYYDAAAFEANLFSAGFGQAAMFNQITASLDAAGAVQARPEFSLLLSDGQTSDIFVTRLLRRQPIFYYAPGGAIADTTIGPGDLSLRLKAEGISGMRGVCKVTAKPVFTPAAKALFPSPADKQKFGELFFDVAAFEVKMTPGDIVLLTPHDYQSKRITLAGLFFTRSGPRSVFTTFMIVCNKMNY